MQEPNMVTVVTIKIRKVTSDNQWNLGDADGCRDAKNLCNYCACPAHLCRDANREQVYPNPSPDAHGERHGPPCASNRLFYGAAAGSLLGVDSAHTLAKRRTSIMTGIGIDYDSTQAQFVLRIPPELHLVEHNGDIWFNYEEALKLHTTLGELLKLCKDKFGASGGIKLI
jgi:hypothetical protein